MGHRKGEGYDWLLMGFGVLVAAVSAQNEAVGVLCFRLALVMALFVVVRLLGWSAGRAWSRFPPRPLRDGAENRRNMAGRKPRIFCAYCLYGHRGRVLYSGAPVGGTKWKG